MRYMMYVFAGRCRRLCVLLLDFLTFLNYKIKMITSCCSEQVQQIMACCAYSPKTQSVWPEAGLGAPKGLGVAEAGIILRITAPMNVHAVKELKKYLALTCKHHIVLSRRTLQALFLAHVFARHLVFEHLAERDDAYPEPFSELGDGWTPYGLWLPGVMILFF